MRGLMALVLIIGGGLGWVIHRAHVQRDAVAAIRRVGGEAAYSWQWSNRAPVTPRSKPPWSDWVRRILGPDFLDTVTFATPEERVQWADAVAPCGLLLGSRGSKS